MKLSRWLFTSMAVLALSSNVQAHTDEYLDTLTGDHGGQIRMAGPWHFELVLDKTADGSKAMPVTVYLTDHGNQAIATEGGVAKITIISQQKPVQVSLQAKAPNLLVGEAVYKAEPALKAVVQLELTEQSHNARFTPFAPKPAAKPAEHEHKHEHEHKEAAEHHHH